MDPSQDHDTDQHDDISTTTGSPPTPPTGSMVHFFDRRMSGLRAQDVHKRATSTSAIDIAGFTKGPLKTIGKILLVFVVDEDGTRPEITLDEAKALFLAAPYSVSECVTLPQ